MSRQSPWPGEGLPLSSFRDGRSDVSPEAFEIAFGRAFLVLSGLRLKRSHTTHITLGDARSTDPISTPSGSFTVFPVLKRPGAPFDFVAVGRASGNDIVLRDASVSKFHAYLRETEEGFLLQDGGSKNGTTRNGVSVARRGAGRPSVLEPGDQLKFGTVPVTFLLAAGLYELVTGLAHTPW